MGHLLDHLGAVEVLRRLREGGDARRLAHELAGECRAARRTARDGTGTPDGGDAPPGSAQAAPAAEDEVAAGPRNAGGAETGAKALARGERVRPVTAGTRGDLPRLLEAWRARLELADPEHDLAAGEAMGARLIVPGDIEWPTQLDDLGTARPYGLWLHGDADLRFSCLRSVAVVGSRAATAYGAHVAAEFGAALGDAGWTVVSGGAYGIDGAAHRGALASASPTVVVLACGTDVDYPLGHHDLFRAVRGNGLLVSECAPGVRPTRWRFLVRNRLIAALSRGTVVVEAALRSGALNTAGHAESLRRPVGAVPGPVTSAASAGCHRLIREGRAVCVTRADEVIELVGAIGDDLAPPHRGPVLPRDLLSESMRRVLDAVPAGVGAGPATIAVAAGVDLPTVLSCLGGLAAAGYVERHRRGWRLRPDRAR
nr:MAG: DNA-protecting protein DprA [Actinomycetota bacterium]